MRALVLLGPPALLLAGCGAPAPEPANDSDDTVALNDATVAGDVEAAENAAMPPFAEVDNAHPYGAPEPAPIPAKFRGTWTGLAVDCAVLDHPERLTISGATVRAPGRVARVDTVRADDRGFAWDGHVEDVPAERLSGELAIDANGERLTDATSGLVRKRCG